MPLINETYDQQKIDRLKHFLESMAERGQPRPFEIFVDSLKVVPKTEKPEDFDNYEFYLNEDTRKVRIVIYNTPNSPRNDQYCYTLQGSKDEGGLNGTGGSGLGEIIQQKLDERDRHHELARLREKLEEKEKALEEAEEEMENLNKMIDQMREGQHKKQVSMAEFTGALLNGFVKQNPKLLKSLPDGLAGLLQNDQPALPAGATATQESEASFEPKGAAAPTLTPYQQSWLSFGDGVQSVLTAEQMAQLFQINNTLAHNATLIPEVVNILTIPTEPSTQQQL